MASAGAMVGGAWRVPDGTRVYAIGDIHGRADLLERLHAAIREDAADAPPRRVVVYVGDYIDRGPDSAEVVDALLAGPLEGFEVVCLKGNHEDLMLGFIDDPSSGDRWLMNGGDVTLESYGVEPPSLSAPDFTAVARRLAARLPEAHRRFFDSLQLGHWEGDYHFVHAGLRPGVPVEAQSDQDRMWIRGEFMHAEEGFGCCVVHGHTILGRPEVTASRISIDTGAFRTGVLTAAVLDGGDVRFLSTGAVPQPAK